MGSPDKNAINALSGGLPFLRSGKGPEMMNKPIIAQVVLDRIEEEFEALVAGHKGVKEVLETVHLSVIVYRSLVGPKGDA